MTIYHYRCTSCNSLVESESTGEEIPCEKCGKLLVRIYNFGGFSFKGSGFYKNDKNK